MKHSKVTLIQVERYGWMLWLYAFSIIIAAVITVYLLYVRVSTELTDGLSAAAWLRESYYTGVGIAGLVSIFILYTIVKQIELRSLRRALRTEESELEDVRARLSELSTMFQVATSLEIRLPVDSILQIMVRRVLAALKGQQASVMLYNPETEFLETKAFYGVEAEYTSNAKRRVGEGIAGKVAELNQSILLPSKESKKELAEFYKPHRNISSAISVPIRVDNLCIGVLNVNRINHPQPFNDHQKDVLKIFAEHVGSVIQGSETMEKLDQRAKGLEVVNTRLSEMNRVKDVFLSTASHELKTPLTSIIGYAEILDDHLASMDDGLRQDFIGRLRAEAVRLMKLIDDILDLTRLETGKAELRQEQVSLNDMARAAIETTQAIAKKREVTLQDEFDPAIELLMLDEGKTRQCIINLIGNAVKFSPTGGVVTVRTIHGEEFSTVEVEDQGPGVKAEDAANIFDMFGQGIGKEAKGQGGLGIGLHLVKRIIELHGGEIGVNAAPEQGSVFWMRFPHSSAAGMPHAEAA